MKNKTLMILAAGLGSRYGGLKQMEGVGPNGEFIIDYSIYDAIRCGFNKIVFIIKEENSQAFKDTIGKRIHNTAQKNNIKIEYVFQNLNNIPECYKIPEERIKPLGTAHAMLCAKDVINEPFVIINSDDFYGYNAYKQISEYLDNNTNDDIGLIGYYVKNTLTEYGSVKRGICEVKNNKLLNIIESKVSNVDGKIIAEPIDGTEAFAVKENNIVSMSMLAFYPSFLKYIDDNFKNFLDNADLLKEEYLMPMVVDKSIKENKFAVNVIPIDEKWVGVTYKEDKPEVINYINSLIKDKTYPKNLWK